jgi:predicted dithiol-disulfide oxidoreductase (DUF899 family)
MTTHVVGTPEEWRAARVALLEAEKELTRRSDELARQRQQLPWVRIDKDYRFDTEDGEATLRDLFRGRSQLIVHHFMYPPSWDEGCPSCSSVADGYDGFRVHLEHHDVAKATVSRAPIEKLTAYKRRMGWSFPWVSSFRNDFNYDFGVSYTEPQLVQGAEHNYRRLHIDPSTLPGGGKGTEPVDAGESAGMSTFVLDDGVVYQRLLRLRPRDGRHVGDVPVARPSPARSQRERPVVPPPRRVRGGLSVRVFAHLGGLPLEELLLLAGSAAGVTVAVARHTWWRMRHGSDRPHARRSIAPSRPRCLR